MTDQKPGSLFDELKKRRVFRVVVVYVVAGLGLIEASDLILPRLGLPDWTVTLVVALSVLGFPVAVALAWAFDVGPGGLRRAPGSTPSVRRVGRRWALGAVAVFALLAIGLAARNSIARGDRGDGAADIIAVLPFEVRGSADLAYLGEGMVNLLSTKMDGAGGLRSVDARALLSRLSDSAGRTIDPDLGSATARHFGAGRFVLGDIVQGGDRLRVSATLYRTDEDGARALADGSAEGRADDIFGLVDSVAAQLLAEAAPGPVGRTRRVAAITTSSLQAFRAYVEGENAFRGGQYTKAAEALERAISLDSTFALAWYRLSLASEYRGLGREAQQAAIQALRHAGRLADRDRRMLEAFMAWRAGDSFEAERLYRAHVASYPDDVEAWFELGEVLFHLNPLRGRSFLEAEDAFRRVIGYEPGHDGALIHLVRIVYAKQDLAAMDTLIRAMQQGGASERSTENLALQAFAHGDSARIAEVLRLLEDAADDEVAFALWVVGTFGRNVEGAEAIARVMIRPGASGDLRAAGHVTRAYLRMARGRWHDALAEMDAAARVDPTYALEHRAALMLLPFAPATRDDMLRLGDRLRAMDSTMLARRAATPHSVFGGHDGLHRLIRDYSLALVSAELGDHTAADSLADALSQSAGQLRAAGFMKASLLDDFQAYVRARSLLQRGRTAEAMAELERMKLAGLYPHFFSLFEVQALERFTLSETLVAMDRHDEALPRYRTIVGSSPLELALLAPAHLRQAEIHQRAGRKQDAARHYRAFLELWSDPDPELVPTRDAARRALQRL